MAALPSYLRPAGPKWVEYCKRLFSNIPGIGWGPEPRCYYCGHTVHGRDCGEVAHIISPLLRADLAWSRPNLRPSHGGDHTRTGGQNKRCQDCGLNCNWLAHNSPDAPRDGHGRSLPFTPGFIAAKQAQQPRRRKLAAVPPEPVREHGRVF
jgi:hypothetical protein